VKRKKKAKLVRGVIRLKATRVGIASKHSPKSVEKPKKKPKIKFLAAQLKLFWYWMSERHAIYLKRFKDKAPYPWTQDRILNEFKFTNVYRQLDRVSLAWQDRYINLINSANGTKKVLASDILFHNVMFRLFNLPETYDALYFGMKKWDKKDAIRILTKRKDEDHEQIFTGAYIIPNGGRDDPKIEVICDAVDYVWKRKIKLANKIRRGRKIPGTNQYEGPSMQYAVEVLMSVPTIGGFIGYELACDLRFTKVLHRAKDVLSWANPGPGAMRGIRRLMYGKHTKVGGIDYIEAMRMLLAAMPEDLRKHLRTGVDCPLELREIEHSLCEFDKYMRVKMDEGRPRSRYHPPREPRVVYDDEE